MNCCKGRLNFPHRNASGPLYQYRMPGKPDPYDLEVTLLEVLEAEPPPPSHSAFSLRLVLRQSFNLTYPVPKQDEKIREIFGNPQTRVAIKVSQDRHITVVFFENKDFTIDAVGSLMHERSNDPRTTTYYLKRIRRRGKWAINPDTREWINQQVAKVISS